MDGFPVEKGTFAFRCYPGIGCFNRCCHNLNLFLHPYDVLRLKQKLALTASEFLERYTDLVLRDGNHFPEVLLRMADNEAQSCTFLDQSGCRVYADRPHTCRTFPVELGLLFGEEGRKPEMVGFFRPPDFCLGQHEDHEWTGAAWTQDQGDRDYHNMTLRWADLKQLFQSDPWGAEGPEGPRAKMAFMAAYNIDRFREFVFHSSFLKRYKVKTAVLKKIKADEEELLKFGFDWVKLFLWNIKTKKIRPRKNQSKKSF